MDFYKLEATGNDFVIIQSDNNENINVKKICDRHFGIGGDGLITIDQNKKVTIYNADGSIAKMCGNGLRCLGYLLSKIYNKLDFDVFLANEKIQLSIDYQSNVTVLMPQPILLMKENEYYVQVLNNHLVILSKDIDCCVFDEYVKEKVEKEHLNVHFVQVLNRNNIKIKTYEYGVKETLGCGSGAIAAFYTLLMLDKVDEQINVISLGGSVICFFKNNQYYLKGKANLIYKGVIIDGF